MVNRTLALILIFVSFGALACDPRRSAAAALSNRSASLDEQRPASCPPTQPPAVPFTPPGEREGGCDPDTFWVGTEKLYQCIPKSGDRWAWAPGTGEKIFWGSAAFDLHKNEDYSLKVTGRRLDGDAPPLVVEGVTNAIGKPHDFLLTGVYVPTPGCWEITGEYKGDKLSFIVWVYAYKPGDQ